MLSLLVFGNENDTVNVKYFVPSSYLCFCTGYYFYKGQRGAAKLNFLLPIRGLKLVENI